MVLSFVSYMSFYLIDFINNKYKIIIVSNKKQNNNNYIQADSQRLGAYN
jgi:hypothetical protein